MIETLDRYFSVYLDHPISQVKPGEVIAVASSRREREEVGWGYTVAIWVHLWQARAIISVRPDLFEKLQALLAERPAPEELRTPEWRTRLGSLLKPGEQSRLVHVLYCRPERLRLFTRPECRQLREADVEAFVKLKLTLYPECDPECLATDILRNIRDGIAFGCFHEGQLVSVTEAPAIGHMQDLIEELGVDTLPEYRGRGYGKAVVSATTKAILDLGRIPVARIGAANEPALRLAASVGYEKYADIIEFSPDRID